MHDDFPRYSPQALGGIGGHPADFFRALLAKRHPRKQKKMFPLRSKIELCFDAKTR
jgi:hypothetical protein